MIPGFSRLSVSGYRRLKALDIGLGPFNVLIGANGVGKSSFLDIFNLLAASAGGTLQMAISDLGGMASLLTADGTTNGIKLAIQIDQEDAAPLDYGLRLSSETVGYAISNEVLEARSIPERYIDAEGPRVRYWDAGSFTEPNWDYKSQETALSQVPRTHRKAESVRRMLDDISEVYHSLDVSTRAPVRAPQTVSPTQIPRY